MDAQVQEKEIYEPLAVNPWLRPPAPPTEQQIRYATDLCRTELPYAERVATIRTFDGLDVLTISELIDRLKDLREARLARLRRARRRRRR